MFSVFSRLTKPGDGKKSSAPAPMSSSLQKKFSRGVHYNMKILIKGDRNVGKTCLLQRLQGGAFIEEYRPTDQIQAAPINWMYKETDHIVKVEVWEVVDKAQAKKKGNLGLKLENAAPGAAAEIMETPQLDATFLDVYKNANGVILMLDITKPWTFDYVQRELVGIPADIPVIILGNHCDMHHHRQVHPHQIEYVMEMAKQNRTGSIRYAEASMRNGFGLRLLHKFLSIPFLNLQKSTLLTQIQTNQQETDQALIDLDNFQNSDEADYNSFLEKLASRRKQEASGTVPIRQHHDRSPSIVLGGGKPIIPPNVNPLQASSAVGVSLNRPFLGPITSLVPSQEALKPEIRIPSPQENPVVIQLPALPVGTPKKQRSSEMSPGPKSANDLDNFCAGVLDHSFLDDMSPTAKSQPDVQVPNTYTKQNEDSDSDDEVGANPLVVRIQDDLDSSDQEVTAKEYHPPPVPELTFSIKENITKNVSKTAKVLQLNATNTAEPLIKSYISSENVFTPYKENDQNKMDSPDGKVSKSNSNGNIFNEMDKLTVYDSEKIDVPSEEETYDSGPEFNHSNVYIPTPMWPIDTSIRRSPEGGEDVSPDAEIKKEKKSKEERKHKKSKKSKDKDKEKDRGSDKDKRREKDKDRERKHRDKKPKKKDSDSYLEEFLNGSTSGVERAQEAYEDL